MTFSFMTLNAQGLRSKKKQSFFAALMLSRKVDCLFVQETHFVDPRDSSHFLKAFGLRGVWSFGTAHSCGVGILFGPSFQGRVGAFRTDLFGRAVGVDVSVDGRSLRLICVYAPNRPVERRKFFQSLDVFTLTSRDTVLAGDLNCVLHPLSDKRGGDPRSSAKGTESLSQLVTDCQLIDTWRLKHGDEFSPTWEGQGVFCRLDHIFVSSALARFVSGVEVVPVGDPSLHVSDHCAVAATFSQIGSVSRGRGLWRLNVSLLEDAMIKEDIGMLLTELCSPANVKDAAWWSSLKDSVVRQFQRLGREKAARKKEELLGLNRTLSAFIRGNRVSPHPEALSAIDRLKKRIGEIQSAAFGRFRQTAFCDHLERESGQSGPFFRHYKSRLPQTVFDCLKTAAGDVLTTSDLILKECQSHFSAFFQSKDVDESNLNQIFRGLPELRPGDVPFLESKLDEASLRSSVMKLVLGRAPGPDGLPVALYRTFWDIIGHSFTAMVNSSFATGRLPGSFSEGTIVLHCKNAAQRDSLSAWRPITLLNTDYKIVSKCLATRLGFSLDGIVHPSQTCAVPRRSLRDSLTALRDAIFYVENKLIAACLLSLDQKKAFDVLSWLFLFFALEMFGFGPLFRARVKLLYESAASRVCVNGNVSEIFPIQRGIRQGCPLSPGLYVLCIEVLACAIRRDPLIRGLPLPGNADKSLCEQLHADDVNLLVCDERSVFRALAVFDLYGACSGSALNFDKCQFRWLGAWSHRRDNPFNLQLCSGPIKVLGVWFGEGARQVSWDSTLRRLELAVSLWQRPDAPFSAKVAIINRVFVPILAHVASVFPIPPAITTKVEKLLFGFFWHPKTVEVVSRAAIRLPPDQGGWGICDFETVFLARDVLQVIRILRSPDSVGFSFCRYLLGVHDRRFCSGLRGNSFPRSAVSPDYYRRVISCVLRVGRAQPDVHAESIGYDDWVTLVRPSSDALPPADPVSRGVSWSAVWSRVFHKSTEAKRKDLNWKIARHALPVRQILARHGICRSAVCPVCGEIESLQHIFVDCINAAGVWRAVAGLFGTGKLSASTILFMDPFPVPPEQELQFLLLITESKYQLWLARNSNVFENKRDSLADIIHRIRSNIQFRLQCEMHRLGPSAFRRLWASPAALCLNSGTFVDLIF